jgi:hypothetical protein
MTSTEVVQLDRFATAAYRPSKRVTDAEPQARVARSTARRWRRVAAQWDAMQAEIGEAVLRP